MASLNLCTGLMHRHLRRGDFSADRRIMRYGFVKVAAATPALRVADCSFNADRTIEVIKAAEEMDVKILALPELGLCGYTCGDLFLQDTMLESCLDELFRVTESTRGMDVLTTVGLPFVHNSKLYNVAAVIQNGQLLGLIPKHFLPNYAEFYESRHFMPGKQEAEYIDVRGHRVPFGMNILFRNEELKQLAVGVEICEDLWMPQPPSGSHVLAGATIIVNPSASDELAGKSIYRRDLVRNQSARLVCGYIYADAGEGESTTDLVFAGHNLIVENGTVLAESELFKNDMIVSEIDVTRIVNERRRMTSYSSKTDGYICVEYSYERVKRAQKKDSRLPVTALSRVIDRVPFIPEEPKLKARQFEEIMMIQAIGLKRRLEHIGSRCAVIGISGGLDSTLALLITKKAFDLCGFDTKNIFAVTMPCFGTSDRTYRNAQIMSRELGIELKEIDIKPAVLQHYRDIGQNPENHDLTFENAQARERTQILMDLAGMHGGIVVGTGDMSELALGWATYNGDHMSMYGVNASVPKTLVRGLVLHVAETTDNRALKEVLLDVLDTPVSPELLPARDGETVQITEDLVGPYELHDFFIYYVIRYGFTPEKIYHLACLAFEGRFDGKTIYKWLTTFYKRFFSQQFKRSCLPDGPKVGSVALSPRGDWRMPSDACRDIWLKNLETIEPQ